MFATGDDLQKSSAELVQLTNALLTAENLLAAAKAGGYVSDTARHTAEVAQINERIKLVLGYRSLLDVKPPAAPLATTAGNTAGAATDKFLGIGDAARAAAAKAAAKVIADASKAETAAREEAFKAMQDMVNVEITAGRELFALRPSGRPRTRDWSTKRWWRRH